MDINLRDMKKLISLEHDHKGRAVWLSYICDFLCHKNTHIRLKIYPYYCTSIVVYSTSIASVGQQRGELASICLFLGKFLYHFTWLLKFIIMTRPLVPSMLTKGIVVLIASSNNSVTPLLLAYYLRTYHLHTHDHPHFCVCKLAWFNFCDCCCTNDVVILPKWN